MRYVYVLLNTLKPGNYVFGNHIFKYEPFYVGHGTGLRWKNHYWNNCESNQNKLDVIKSLKTAGHKPMASFIGKNLSINEAIMLEIDMIKVIGRYPEGLLTNMSNGGEYYRGDNNIKIAQYKLIKDNVAELINIFDKRVDAELKYGNLNACLDKDKIGYGYIWRRLGDNVDEHININLTMNQLHDRVNRSNNFKKTNSQDKRVCKYDTNGNLIDVYPSRAYVEKFGINCNYLNRNRLVLNGGGFFLVYAYKLKNIHINLFNQGFVYVNNGQVNNVKNKIKILCINENDKNDKNIFESIKSTGKERSLRRGLKNKGFLYVKPYIYIKESDYDKLSDFGFHF